MYSIMIILLLHTNRKIYLMKSNLQIQPHPQVTFLYGIQLIPNLNLKKYQKTLKVTMFLKMNYPLISISPLKNAN